MATAGTAAPAPAPAPSTHNGGECLMKRAARARITMRPGTMNAAPPARAPRRPRTRHAQKIASWVEAGPGSRLQALIASSNSVASSHCSRSTHSLRSSAMCAGGPPNPTHPIRPHSRSTVARLAWYSARGSAAGTGSGPGSSGGRIAEAPEEVSDPGVQVGSHGAECRVGLGVAASPARGVREAPVDCLRVTGEFRAYLADPVAQAYHVVEPLPGERADVLGLTAG